VASGLSAHLFAAVISIGPSLSQNKHFNSVRPLKLGMGTIRFLQCKQSVRRSSMVTSFVRPSTPFRNFGSKAALQPFGVMCMEEVINRVMGTYGMMVNLTPREAQATRERLTAHLARMDADEKALAVEGLRFLRGPDRVARRRIARIGNSAAAVRKELAV